MRKFGTFFLGHPVYANYDSDQILLNKVNPIFFGSPHASHKSTDVLQNFYSTATFQATDHLRRGCSPHCGQERAPSSCGPGTALPLVQTDVSAACIQQMRNIITWARRPHSESLLPIITDLLDICIVLIIV